MNIQYPPVSCMCLTYGRPTLLEEAVYSFLLQEYPGQKELIILNDCSRHHFIFDHPEVKIINLEERFKTVGSKRNHCAGLCGYDYLFPWDDDDIHLPHRLKFSIDSLIRNRTKFFKPATAYYWNNGEITSLEGNSFHAQSCFTRDLFNSVGGYPDIGAGEDLDFEEKVAGGRIIYTKIKVKENYYLYRWAGLDSYHLSAFGRDDQNEETIGGDKVYLEVEASISRGLIPEGKIELSPRWSFNYLFQKDQFDKLHGL